MCSRGTIAVMKWGGAVKILRLIRCVIRNKLAEIYRKTLIFDSTRILKVRFPQMEFRI